VKTQRALKLLDGNENIISKRLRQARDHHVPAYSAERLVSEIQSEQDLLLDVGIIHKIESQARGAQDYEVAAFSRVLGVSSDWLLGLTNEGGPQ
jgi:hypothetical protein